MGKLSTFITRLKQTLTKIGEDVKDLRDNKANVSDIPDVSNFVPYTGATDDIDVGDNRLFAWGVSTNAGSSHYSYNTSVSSSNPKPLLNIDKTNIGTSATGYAYIVRLSTTGTGSVTGRAIGVYYNDNAWRLVRLSTTITKNSNTATMEIVDGIPYIVTAHSSSYSISVTVEAIKVNPSYISTNIFGPNYDVMDERYAMLSNLSDYVLQSSLNTQLANYVTTNGVQNITATKTFTVAPIVPNGTLNGHTVNLGQLNDKLGDKAEIDGSNTMGGTWNINTLRNNDVGNYIERNEFTNSIIGIPSTDALGYTVGVLLMGDGAPLVIAENDKPDWDGYIYRAGTPKPGYPSDQQNGNYLIESKHRFRLHTITAPDSTSGNVGSLQINPFNGIEHNHFRVTISSVDSLDITIDEPYYDEITGFNIERNAIGQKCTVAVSGGLSLVKFNNVSGADFTSEWNKGVFDFYWTGTSWIFGGYSPIEP